MIILDADVLVIDLSHPNDPNFAVNERFLDYLTANNVERGIATQGLLEVVGKRAFRRRSRSSRGCRPRSVRTTA